MGRIGVLLGLLLASGASTGLAQAGDEWVLDTDEMPPPLALVRYKPRSAASGDWILGTMTSILMRVRTCAAVDTHLLDDPLLVIGNDDSLEVAWRGGSTMHPRDRAQVDSMADGSTWLPVNLGKALEGVPVCLPEYR